MELSHLLKLVSELPNNSTLNYVRGTDTCKFIGVDVPGERINSETPTKEPKSWAPSYLQELAPRIKENVPFNLSGLLNNKGSFRPVLETIIAHTREFYTVRKGTATALVWIPSKPKANLELEEINSDDIPAPINEHIIAKMLSPEELPEHMKKAFLLYFSNYLRLSTGKCDEAKISQYLKLYNRFVEDPLKERGLDYYSIFQFTDLSTLNDFLFSAKESLPDLAILLDDKWPQNKEDQTLYYEVWTMVRHYKAFLELLKSIKLISSSINTSLSLSKFELNSVNSNDIYYLRAMRTKPFLLLAGISGTGKSRIVKQMAFDSCPDVSGLQSDQTSPGNYCLIEVKPNWHDSTELLGYESKIGGDHYVLTPFVKFLVKAMLYPDVPFFVCLDEMNLAPVEQYFAEFLSVLESRTKIDGHIVSEPLIKASIFANSKYANDLKHDIFNIGIRERQSDGVTLYDAELSEDEEYIYQTLRKQGLRIPENVVIIGTVNMDETTHQFSRKVIDRAMTIEMNLPEGTDDEGNAINPFKAFFDNSSELTYREDPTSPSLYLATETKASDVVNRLSQDNAEKTERLKERVAEFLSNLNSTLESTPFKVAYRVQNELLLYFYQLWLENKEAHWRDILATAIDQILMMKVLPRIEGDEELLEKPLERLILFCEPYPNASKKLLEMQARLKQSRFTSFWP